MMVSTVLVLGLWRSMAKTLGRICQQIFITAADIQEMAGSNWEGEVSRVILSLLNLQTSCWMLCLYTKDFAVFEKTSSRGASWDSITAVKLIRNLSWIYLAKEGVIYLHNMLGSIMVLSILKWPILTQSLGFYRIPVNSLERCWSRPSKRRKRLLARRYWTEIP